MAATMKQILLIAALAIAAYLWMGGTGNASTTTPAATNNAGCVAAYEAEYSDQWADMNQLQRAMVGLQAAGCAP